MADIEREEKRIIQTQEQNLKRQRFVHSPQLCTGAQTPLLFLVLCQPSRLLELRKHRNQPDLHTRAPQLYAPLEALITAAAGYDLLTVPPLPRVAVDRLVAAVVYCSNL